MMTLISTSTSTSTSTLIILALLTFPFTLIGQTAEELLQEIRNTSQLLDNTQKTQAEVLDNYYALQHKLSQRAKLINVIQQEINTANLEVESAALAVDSLEIEIERLKEEYSAIMRQAFRQKKSRNDLLFLFSATSFNQALKRWRYMQQYKEYRKKQVLLILEKRASLNEKIQQLTDNKEKQERLLLEEINQRKIVQEEIALTGTIVGQLKKETYEINKLLKAQKEAHQRLAKTVESTISADIDKKEETNKVEVAVVEKESTPKKLSPTISYEFIKRKGQFNWPIQQGVIVRYFGNQPHPIHKKIIINNNGIDVKARSNPTVFSLHEGVVKAIQIVPGYKNTLILQHGDYYTVYSNLESVKVKKGEIVSAQQAIGIAAIPAQKEQAELHLEVWKGKQRLNPFSWLRKL